MDEFHLIEMSYACTRCSESAVVTEYTWDPIKGHQVTWKFDGDLNQQAVLIDVADFAELISLIPITSVECDRHKCTIYLYEIIVSYDMAEHVKKLQQISDDEGMTFKFVYDKSLERIYVT